MINAGTQPMQNLSVLNHYSSDPKEKAKWARHFIDKGLKGMNFPRIPLQIKQHCIFMLFYYYYTIILQVLYALFKELKRFWNEHLENTVLVTQLPLPTVVLSRKCIMLRGIYLFQHK